MDYLAIANSNMLFIIVTVVLLIVAAQAVVFIRMAVKRCGELGIEKPMVNKVITNSAVFSLLPSLPIIITMLAMMPSLGKYIPWLRLSVIGSAMYESLAADIAVKALGFSGLGDTGLTPNAFGSIVWVMTLGVMVGPLLNVVLLKSYDKTVKGMMKAGGFLAIAVGSLFTGFMAVNGIPRLLNFGDLTALGVTYISGFSAVILDSIGKKQNIKIMSEFSFPLAMVIGMASAIVLKGILA